jgi:hypothetical protein
MSREQHQGENTSKRSKCNWPPPDYEEPEAILKTITSDLKKKGLSSIILMLMVDPKRRFHVSANLSKLKDFDATIVSDRGKNA